MKSLPSIIIPIVIALSLVLPVSLLLGSDESRTLSVSALSDLTYGGDPKITSPLPDGLAFTGWNYAAGATCSSPDNETTTWALESNASWLSISSGGSGFETCNVSGIPTGMGTYWANLTVNDTDSFDYLNWTIIVKDQGKWGMTETLSSLPTGTHDPFGATFPSGKLELLNADFDEESVMFDGTLATFSRGNEDNKTVAVFDPNHIDDGLGWNMSVEVYPTKEASAFREFLKPVPKLGLIIYLGNDSVNLTAVALYVGEPSQGYERIKILDATTGLWSDLALDILPSYPNRHDDNPGGPLLSDSIYGEKPDRYLVSFRYLNSASTCRITIIHTSIGLVGAVDVPLPVAMPDDFKLRFVSDVEIPSAVWGYWMIDDFAIRGLSVSYPVAGPVYEYVTKGNPVWVSVRDIDRNPIPNADVAIAGSHAVYNSTTQRYETHIELSVGWNQPVQYTVSAGGVDLVDSMYVTIMTDLKGSKVSMPLWWNGWAWVSVFGRDDSLYATAATDTFWSYSHPATSYVMSDSPGGTSPDILPTQSEIALHWPHDYLVWPKRFWNEAVIASATGHTALEGRYTYASRWDNPAYVGAGDMYISIACPGNSGSWEQMYAEYARGTRIMGFTSNPYNGAPGNTSLIGAWWVPFYPPESGSWLAPISQWYPYATYDMMDAVRGPSTDKDIPSYEWLQTFWMAQHGGVRRFYNHGIISSTAALLLHWIDDPKTNFSYENWKATDGEVASYVYGRWSTDVVFDDMGSNSTITAYRVSRADPITSGYWRVPVTIAFNATGRSLSDIVIKEGSLTLSMSDGSLRNITGKRVMDVGYDIRGGTIYVSYFWNASSLLSFIFSDAGPEPNTPPTASFIVDEYQGNITRTFVFDASTSTDVEDPLSSLQFRWDWDGNGVWDTDWSSNPIAYHQFVVPGKYTVKLQVMDRGGLTGEAQASVEVTDIEIPEMPSILVAVISMLVLFSAIAFVSRPRRKKR